MVHIHSQFSLFKISDDNDVSLESLEMENGTDMPFSFDLDVAEIGYKHPDRSESDYRPGRLRRTSTKKSQDISGEEPGNYQVEHIREEYEVLPRYKKYFDSDKDDFFGKKDVEAKSTTKAVVVKPTPVKAKATSTSSKASSKPTSSSAPKKDDSSSAGIFGKLFSSFQEFLKVLTNASNSTSAPSKTTSSIKPSPTTKKDDDVYKKLVELLLGKLDEKDAGKKDKKKKRKRLARYRRRRRNRYGYRIRPVVEDDDEDEDYEDEPTDEFEYGPTYRSRLVRHIRKLRSRRRSKLVSSLLKTLHEYAEVNDIGSSTFDQLLTQVVSKFGEKNKTAYRSILSNFMNHENLILGLSLNATKSKEPVSLEKSVKEQTEKISKLEKEIDRLSKKSALGKTKQGKGSVTKIKKDLGKKV